MTIFYIVQELLNILFFSFISSFFKLCYQHFGQDFQFDIPFVSSLLYRYVKSSNSLQFQLIPEISLNELLQSPYFILHFIFKAFS